MIPMATGLDTAIGLGTATGHTTGRHTTGSVTPDLTIGTTGITGIVVIAGINPTAAKV
jgi:hypothetical protein